MPEFISLLSSSPPSNPPKPEPSRPSRTIASAIPISLLSDEVLSSESGDFQIDRPAKKRKVAAGGLRSFRSCSPNLEPVLSSDHDLCLLPPAIASKAHSFEIHLDENDEIVFSSSAPEQRRKDSPGPSAAVYDVSSDDLPDFFGNEPFSFSQPTEPSKSRSCFSERTANILANLAHQDTLDSKAIKNRHHQSSSKPPESTARFMTTDLSGTQAIQRTTAQAVDDIVFSSSPKPAPKKAARKTADKEAEKERKRIEKEQRVKEKQKAADIAEVNKSKTNKKDSVHEMIVEMSRFFEGSSIGNQVEEYMKQLEVPVTFFDEEVNLLDDNHDRCVVGNIVRWRRKITAEYDAAAGQWRPSNNPQIKAEKHILVHLTAIEMATIAAGRHAQPSEDQMKENLDAQIAVLRSQYPDCTLIYIFQGMQSWVKKNQTARNREYTAAVRGQLLENENAAVPTSSQVRPRKSKKAAQPTSDLSFLTSDMVEDLLLHLQLAHQPILIQHTTSPATTASQISAFTQHLSTRPYRLAQQNYNLKSAAFCMDGGQVRTGDDAKDTYIKMLQEIQRVTPSMAYGIAAEWSSVSRLMAGFKREGNLMLEDVRKTANKDGAWTDRRLGPMVSRRLFKVFMGRDAAAMDGMA